MKKMLAVFLSLALLLCCSGASYASAYPAYGYGPAMPGEVAVHCDESALRVLDAETLSSIIDLVKYRLQPQSVNLLLAGFPAFAEAARMNQLGREIGFNVCCESLEEGLAAVQIYYTGDEYNDYHLSYRVSMNLLSIAVVDEEENPVFDPMTGNLILTTDEKAFTELESTITHEMMHAFMFDYNRSGMTGFSDMDSDLTEEEEDYYEEATVLPTWFKEGYAVAVENEYAYRREEFDRLSYMGGGRYSEWVTPEILRYAFDTDYFQRSPGGEEFWYPYDLSWNPYVTGYLACIYLGDLAANSEGLSSYYIDENGREALDSSVIRYGLNAILRMLHEGTPLDDIISDISGGEFYDTEDFEDSFITESDDSAWFCCTYLNYMRTLSRDGSRLNLPSGSVLIPFDADVRSTIDRTQTASAPVYRMAETNDYVPSTADLSDVRDAGKSLSWYDLYTEAYAW